MNRYWSPVVARLHPYVPGEQPREPNLVKLNTNESPYGPSPRVLEALRAQLGDGLRLYPNPESDPLCEAIARAHDVPRTHVFAGNGSDEVLAHAFQALLHHEAPILLPDVTYSFYTTYCELYGIAYEQVALSDDFAIDPARFSRPNGGIVFANPNAPTGRLLPLEQVERLIQASDHVVLVDEAYIDFGGASAIPLVERYENLIVVQTFSKSRALAGLRVGFAIAQPHLIEALVRVKNSFNSYPVDRLASVAAIAALEDTAWFEDVRGRVIASRSWLAEELGRRDFDVVPSATNFLFVRHRVHSAEQLAAALRARGVLVRHFKKPRIEPFLRITVGTPEQCRVLVDALGAIL